MRFNIFTICIFLLVSCKEKSEKTVFDTIFMNGSDSFKSVIKDKEQYEVQILFSPITRIEDSIIVEDHFFNFRPGEYFYPASIVKMPVVFMALQKLEELHSTGLEINRNTALRIDSIRPLQKPVIWDSTAAGTQPTIAHYIDKIFVSNDNDAFNRLFEFCGLDYINAGLKAKGIFTNSRIVNRLGVEGFSLEENKHTPPIHFLDEGGNIIYTNRNTVAQGYHLTLVDNTQKGVAYIENDDKIDAPFDFSEKNFINIKDLQESLKRFVLPSLFYSGQRFKLNEDDRLFVLESMAKLPKEHSFLEVQTQEYYNTYAKSFLFGDSNNSMSEHVIIRNKTGLAYGYLTECAYIQDKNEGVEYFLTVTIHVNKNKTYNDGIYQYDEVGIPFLAELGRMTHNYMIKNK